MLSFQNADLSPSFLHFAHASRPACDQNHQRLLYLATPPPPPPPPPSAPSEDDEVDEEEDEDEDEDEDEEDEEDEEDLDALYLRR